jgi:hypothetical protein
VCQSYQKQLRITKYAESENSIIYDIDMKRVMAKLHENQLARIQDPMGISGYIKPCISEAKKDDALSKLQTGLTRAENAYSYREKDLDKCFEWWDKFFAGKFPSR